ncbi:carboxypeptidase-like regulatory domain-containing protein [Formosa sediminum]|uniref:Carboxypeptidase-like regulatory domain-containing protein n=1 Tax=Formosa sediminum TaxID=2594004 RepID=A0A516GPY9_9FLAO|nr:carboxypeptidase-like regulatory domain-containing protein [Formosa sediminum]QDO93591.1 carboxypeptidase-like regulatory domain-containing protein [Formosa sediminum]
MKQFYILLFICLTFSVFSTRAQTQIHAKVLDSTNLEPISFATISFNNTSGVISNDIGQFQLQINTPISEQDSLIFSCLGYESKHIAAKTFQDSIVVLKPKSIELNEVMLFNKNYTVDEIIEKVEDNLDKNYGGTFQKSKLFFRETYGSTILRKSVKIKTSTIPEFNQELTDSILSDIPLNSYHYTEILGEFYKNKSEAKKDTVIKLNILKASELYDKNNEMTFEAYEKKLNAIVKKHVKRDSYFKIKSGWFGTKEDVDSSFFQDESNKKSEAFLEAEKKKEEDKKKNFLKYRKYVINSMERSSFVSEEASLNCIHKSNRYEFELLDYSFLNDQYVYKIAFKPKRSEDYKGILYINTEDFAVIRVDFKNVKSLKTFKLLGVSLDVYQREGSFIYAKNKTGNYSLKYAEIETANKTGIDRPFKIIEKNKHVKGRRKQNELSGDINFIAKNYSKRELVAFENETITAAEFNAYKEKADVKPIYLPAYDPEFWKGYNIIEPNKAIKEFKSIITEKN